MTFDGFSDVPNDNYDAVAAQIAHREASAEYAREKYGLVALLPPNFGHMRNTQNQTEQILAMTISCVPNLATTTTTTSSQVGQISVIIGNIPVNLVQPPILVDGHVLAPVHELLDLLGFCVRWHPQTQETRLVVVDEMYIITLDSDIVTICGGSWRHTLDVPAQVIDGSTMVPIRAILESLGYKVQWDEATQTLIITFE